MYHNHYTIKVWHDGLNKFREIKGTDEYVVKQKAQAQLAQWDEMWQRRLTLEDAKEKKRRQSEYKENNKELALEQTGYAEEELKSLENILNHTLDIDDCVDWNDLVENSQFGEDPPSPVAVPISPEKPDPLSPNYKPKINLLDRIVPEFAAKKRKNSRFKLQKDLQIWEQESRWVAEQFELEKEKYASSLADWEIRNAEFEEAQRHRNESIEKIRTRYFEKRPEVIEEYCDLVLSRSTYPDYFPKQYEMDFEPETMSLVVNYELPIPETLPTLTQVTYVQSRDEFKEKHLPETKKSALYDSIIYQTCLRTIHELFEADAAEALAVVTFNGFVSTLDKATGKPTNPCILSVSTEKKHFIEIDLGHVDPKSCFKSLKGVSCPKLQNMMAVAPLATVKTDDSRFIASREVIDSVDDSANLASMDWEDFEHLIRELFEKEFSGNGGEVNVTKASKDGGVDAIIHDPDPIRGGKIVVQAKRYTRTVDVSAVRDLYGTVHNEGAIKGILVSTSDFGPDAYKFALNKPVTLLSGGNLLSLLQKHGYKARINLEEARKEMGLR